MRFEFDSDGLLTERVEPNGQTISYTYTDADSDGVADELSTITGPDGEVTTFTFTGDLLTEVTDALNRKIELTYDAQDRLISIKRPDPDGAGPLPQPEITYTYDANGRLVSVARPGGATKQFSFSSTGHLTSTIMPNGKTRQFVPLATVAVPDLASGEGSSETPAVLMVVTTALGQTTNSQNQTTKEQRDQFGNLTLQIDPLGRKTQFQRDGNGLLLSRIDPDPDGPGPLPAPVTSYTYDSRGNRTSMTLPNGGTRSWVYHSTLNVATQYTDELGNVTLYDIDPDTADVLSETKVIGQVDDPQNGETDDLVTTFTYTAAPSGSEDPPSGLLLSQTDPLGNVTEYEYDASGDVVTVTNAAGSANETSVSRTYDSAGNLATATDALGTTSYAYDSLERVTQITHPDPDGAGPLSAPVTTYIYDEAGNHEQVTQNGRTTLYDYDSAGQLLSTTQVVGLIDDPQNGETDDVTTSYSYDSGGNRTSVTDPLGRMTNYSYTDGTLDSATLPDGSSTSYTYDAAGNVLTETDALGNMTAYEYDNVGRLIKTTFPDPDDAGPLPALFTQERKGDGGLF